MVQMEKQIKDFGKRTELVYKYYHLLQKEINFGQIKF